jgi:signal transduction histidine kinase
LPTRSKRPNLTAARGFARSAHLRPGWQRYGLVIVITLLVVAGRLALDPYWGRSSNRHLVFLPTVMLTAWLGGFGPGLVSATLSTAALATLWRPSTTETFWHGNTEFIVFFLFCLVICAVIQSLHLARARADAASRSRAHVLAVVAHDLRNPLSTVRMTAEALMQQTGFTSEPAQRRLRSIDRAVSRMEHLIQDLVDDTRIERGELTVNVQSEKVGPIVQEAMEIYAPIAQETGVNIEASTRTGDAVIACDRDRILQVLGNLLGNAIKFTPEGGRVTLETEDLPDAVRFEVRDTGPGIRSEHLPHIFERYWNTDPRGTGLGLYIARSLVRAHRGELEAHSEPGLGARFRFTIPRASS